MPMTVSSIEAGRAPRWTSASNCTIPLHSSTSDMAIYQQLPCRELDEERCSKGHYSRPLQRSSRSPCEGNEEATGVESIQGPTQVRSEGLEWATCPQSEAGVNFVS